jgi:hypothetical protein
MTMSVKGHSARSVLLVAALAGAAVGQRFDFNGRASGWLGASWDTSFLGQAGLRYLPEARLSIPLCKQIALDAEASASGFVSARSRTFDSTDLEARVKPDRALVRLSSSQFEARVGLQKINFGSAMLLRPLMWFDRVDPRDPLELTDGVYGLLGRYYFQNNINVWAWGLLGNSAPKGWEVYGSERWTPEFGGRAQVPIPRGEVAATYHHRAIDYSQTLHYPEFHDEQEEDRFGLDVKMDVGIGLWFEGTLAGETYWTDYSNDPRIWTRAVTLGADYTFSIGSGLGVMAEHMLAGRSWEPLGFSGDAQFSALMVSYPLGLLDNLRAIAYLDWTNRDLYSFVGWQRTTDNWMFSLSAFANPDRPAAAGRPGAGVAGKGVQFEVVFNH